MFQALLNRVAGYPGLFLFCAMSGIVIPFPEDISLMYAGMQISNGTLAWGPTLVVAMFGVMLRDTIAYWVGRLVGEWLLEKEWVRNLLGPKKLDRAHALVIRRGSAAVLFGRFFVGMRAPVFFVAGAMGVGFRKFLVWNSLGMLIAVPGVVVLGSVFGEPLVDATFWIVHRGRVVVYVALALGVGYAVWRRYRFLQARRASAVKVKEQPQRLK